MALVHPFFHLINRHCYSKHFSKSTVWAQSTLDARLHPATGARKLIRATLWYTGHCVLALDGATAWWPHDHWPHWPHTITLPSHPVRAAAATHRWNFIFMTIIYHSRYRQEPGSILTKLGIAQSGTPHTTGGIRFSKTINLWSENVRFAFN